MRTIIKYNILTLLAILLTSISFGQDVTFTAATSHEVVKTGDRFKIQFATNTEVSNFKAPKLNNFRVLSGPNQSTQMSWVNGKTTSSISYTYILMAVKEGEFTIGPAVAAANGKAIKTNSLKIKVGKGVAVQQGGNQAGSQTKSGGSASDELFIKSSVSRRKVYQGEQIIATYKLYTRVGLAGNELVKNADLNGFWSQEIDFGESVWTKEIIGGYRYSVAKIREIVLFPQRSGELEIDPLEMKFIVQKRVQGGGQSVFDQFFGRVENVEYDLKSTPIKITVLPHPANAPVDFTNAVGNLDMKVDVSANEIKANEAINIKIKVSGKGNLPLIDIPTISFPSDFETYDPKINDNIKTTTAGVSGSKEFDYLVIPRHPGQFKLDPVTFSYFDPNTKKYKTITSNPININVLKADGSTADNVVYSSSKEDIKVLGNDIRYIHINNIQFSHSHEDFYGSWKFYLLFFLAPLLFIVAFIFRNKIRLANNDVVGMKKKKASKVAGKFLKSAKQSLEANNTNAFYEAITKALFGYLGDKLHIPTAELNQNNIKEKLVQVNVNEQTVTALMDTIELCDMARFAPVSISEQEVYNKAETIINQIEEEVK
ncbi:MAG: BatD family protein [Vicingaceae bacterium]|nr:BatD family protein [Vicingaceae bacterium]